MGVFPTGGKWLNTTAFDVRFRPGLAGFLASQFVSTVLSPVLKATGAGMEKPTLRVLVSHAEAPQGKSRCSLLAKHELAGVTGAAE